jgi:hypothetical protein
MGLGVQLGLIVLLLAVGVAGASSGGGVGWSIKSVAEPTNLNASDTVDAIEELKVTASGGTYELQSSSTGASTAPIAWDATAGEVQAAIEGIPGLQAAGAVAVAGGVVDGSEARTYTITWEGVWSGANSGLSPVENELKFVNGLGETVEGTITTRQIREPAVPDRYTVTVVNVGSRASEGEVRVVDRLPAGVVVAGPLSAVEAKIEEPALEAEGGMGAGECVVSSVVKCSYAGPVAAGQQLRVHIGVVVLSASLRGPVLNTAVVSGGGGGEASVGESSPVNVAPAMFGVNQFAFEATGADGRVDTQAGDHSFEQTTTVDFNTVLAKMVSQGTLVAGPVREVGSVEVELPLGMAGNPLAAEQCPASDLSDTHGKLEFGHYYTACPTGSVVGFVRVRFAHGSERNGEVVPGGFPLYNVVPERGFPAEFGFNAGLAQPVFLYASVVPGASGYRLRVGTPSVLRPVHELQIIGISVTLFGSPAEHNGVGGGAAFLTNPASCTGEPLTARVVATAWEGGSASMESTAYPDITGCDLLQGAAAFNPTLGVTPESTQADTPSGYRVDLRVPQAPSVFGALATPELKDAAVTLPAGVSISPSAASGASALEGCTAAQIDLLGTEVGEGHPGGNSSPYDDGQVHASPGNCPERSRVGTVEVHTPVLASPLEGHVFLAQPTCGGAGQAACTEQAAEEGKVYGLYLEAAGSGVIIKLAGSVEVGGYGPHSVQTGLAPGQLRTRFDENPQFPFEELTLTLSGGDRSVLANPQACGTATTASVLEPWSAPESGPAATPSSSFDVTGCGGGMPFSPGFSGGVVAPSAGSFTPFTLTLSRHDGEQDLSGVSTTLPPGLLGVLKSAVQCPEPQASQGACGAGSLLGHTQVAAGAGGQPLWVTGQVFLTGPYKGAPFGLSIVVPAKAGPFNLGNVIVRAAIHVDPHTAQITVVSDPLPQLVDGIPLRVKTVNVTVDRPGFTFNPTNCSQLALTGTLASAQGASVSVSSPFAVAGCAGLAFKPSFTVSTQARTSKKNGASLDVKVGYPSGAQANIRSVAVTLPKALPSRLSTIQQACPEATFNANPASCPAGSNIGIATAHTPVLANPVTGPVYLVSHGGAAFPDLVLVLQGEGVTLDLVGSINIKHQVTSSTFASVPDAPISSFELSLPEGPHSGLAAVLPAKAKGNLCGTSLAMPTTLTGQNGAQIKQNTKIQVTGCSKPKKKVKHKKHKKGRKR